MIQDQIFNNFLLELSQRSEQLRIDMAKAKFSELYEVGLIQGHLAGMEMARQLLVNALEAEDK